MGCTTKFLTLFNEKNNPSFCYLFFHEPYSFPLKQRITCYFKVTTLNQILRNIVDATHVDCARSPFTPCSKVPGPERHVLLSSKVSRTPKNTPCFVAHTCLGQKRSCPPPPRGDSYLCIASASSIWFLTQIRLTASY